MKELVTRDILIDAHPGLLYISPYLYNTIEENAIVVAAIAEILEKKKS